MADRSAPVTRRILANFGWLGLARLVLMGVGLLVTALLARNLGPANYGIVGFSLGLVAYFILIRDLGLADYGTREIAAGSDRALELVEAILTLRLLAALAAYGLLAAVVLVVLDRRAVVEAVILIHGLLVVTGALKLDFVYQGAERMHVITLRDVMVSVLSLAGVAALVQSPGDLIWAPVVAVAAETGGVTWMTLRYGRDYGGWRPRLRPAAWCSMLRESLPMALSAFMIAIYYNFDVVMLGFLRSAEEVGAYVAAYKIILALSAFQYLINRSVYPAISHLWRSGAREGMRRIVEAMMTLMAALSFIMTITVFGTAAKVIPLVFGDHYAASILILQILVFSMTLAFNETVLGPVLYASGQQKRLLVAVSVGAAVNVVANFILIPRYGPIGAAAATFLAECFVLGLLLVFVRGVLSVRLMKVFPVPVGASLLCFGMYLIYQGYAALVAAIAVFCAAHLVFGGVREHVRNLTSAAP